MRYAAMRAFAAIPYRCMIVQVAMIRTFRSHGHRDIDTARMYEHGASEEMLGEIFRRDPSVLAACDVATKVSTT